MYTSHNKIQCANCKVIKHNFEIFQYLVFNLENVKQNKINNLASMNQQLNKEQIQLNLECFKNINSVTIYDCFEFSSQIQTLTGEDAFSCNICKNSIAKNFYQSVIYTPPSILIIILDRSQKSKIKLEFSDNLDLLNYIVHAKSVGYIFKLIGVISQEENKHYISYCKNINNQKWYRYDNNNTTEVNNFKNQIVDSNLVDILFYQKL